MDIIIEEVEILGKLKENIDNNSNIDLTKTGQTKIDCVVIDFKKKNKLSLVEMNVSKLK